MNEDYAICISDIEEESNSLFIKGLEFRLTCLMCPEQYDVFLDNVQVAYVRLRRGYLSVDSPDCGDETIYKHQFINKQGCFKSAKQRIKYLKKIARIILRKLR